jgi:hypothetical protein
MFLTSRSVLNTLLPYSVSRLGFGLDIVSIEHLRIATTSNYSLSVGSVFQSQISLIECLPQTPRRELTVQTQSHVATDGQSFSKSWCRALSGAHDQILFITVWQLRSCFCGAPSLMRRRVCFLYMLLALASAVFLGSESLGTCNYILLSQIWDFPFRHILLLAGLAP